jgi:small basic protein
MHVAASRKNTQTELFVSGHYHPIILLAEICGFGDYLGVLIVDYIADGFYG